MPRTTAHRVATPRVSTPRVAALMATATVALSPLLLGLWAAGPAQAHGAPTDPASRVYACSPDGGTPSRSAACRAAVSANGGPFTAWDNLRVANVNGRDRQTIPDGELCSGGLPAYRGLDLARADWPSTRLTPGGTLRMKYVSTIPHTGTFKLYLTKQGYDPSQPLTWADLPARPFAEVTDPALTDGAYRVTAKLPADRTGRQVLYTVWQNSSTPDTYYSCSDVVFPETAKTPSASAAAGGAGGASKRPSAGPSVTATAPASATVSESASASASARASARDAKASSAAPAAAGPANTPVASTTGAGSGPSAPVVAGGAAALLVLTGGAALVLRLRRR